MILLLTLLIVRYIKKVIEEAIANENNLNQIVNPALFW